MIYTYCITFRVANKTIGGKSYDERRQSIVDAVRTDNSGYWDETTSFFLVESDLGTQDLAAQAASGLSAGHDMLAAFDPSDMSVAYFGSIKEPDVLASFFKTAKKVP